ncbi:Predicted arabinose efflux permease, MFS family [Kushneria avicenniae]|uniref:Predicted arabinose efflux permease, MFS family n=1 Tax=Kushneria avicenniae TaxID=402385 RepID=A0A1I1JCQ4_9GAMM|nr:MFS transporter [Kushneria avicenniae]SFC43753.1 Predicted arabinose efflux permease, MFS family [Kushneria avicenniae]
MSGSGTPIQRSPGRLSFLLVTFAFLMAMLGTTLPTPLYPIYQTRMDYSQIIITVIFAAYAVGVIAALIGFGSWSDQLGRRRLLIAGLGLAIVSNVVFLSSPQLVPLLIGRLLSGLSAGIFTGTATVAVIEQAPPEWQKGATLTATATNVMGLGLGPLVAGVLAQYAVWPLHLPYALHIVLCLLAIIGVWWAPETVERPDRVHLHIQRLGVPDEVRGVFIPAGIAGFAGTAVLGLFTAAAPSFVQKLLEIDNLAMIGVVVITLFIASALGQAGMRFIPERRRLIIGCLILATGVLVVGSAIGLASLWLMLIGAAISGAGQGLTLRAGLGEVVGASPADRKSEVTSTYFVVIYVAISLPVVGLGVTAALTSLVAAGIVFSVIVAALALTAMGLLIRRQRREG